MLLLLSVGAAFWGMLLAYIGIFVFSVVFLLNREYLYDELAELSAYYGGICSVVLFVCSIIYQATTGVPIGKLFTPDLAFIITAILASMFVCYIGLRLALTRGLVVAFACAILAILGIADLPWIAYKLSQYQIEHNYIKISYLELCGMSNMHLTLSLI